MSQVNLLPPEIRQRENIRRRTMLVLIAGLVALGLVLVVFLFQAATLGRVNEDIAAEEDSHASLRAEIESLQRFEDLQAEAQAKQQQVSDAYAGEVSFSVMLMDVSTVIPSDAYLTSLTSAITATDASGQATEGGFVGTMANEGVADGVDTVSLWLNRLEMVDGWVNPWAQALQQTSVGSQDYSFSSGVDFTQAVVTPRGRRGEELG